MKKKKVLLSMVMYAASFAAYQKRELLRAIFKLEKLHGDMFTKMDIAGKVAYLSKNDNQSEELFKDWIAYHGWHKADQIGEGTFYVNDAQETLTIEREAVCGGRYILWSASNPIEN